MLGFHQREKGTWATAEDAHTGSARHEDIQGAHALHGGLSKARDPPMAAQVQGQSCEEPRCSVLSGFWKVSHGGPCLTGQCTAFLRALLIVGSYRIDPGSTCLEASQVWPVSHVTVVRCVKTIAVFLSWLSSFS